jgi:acetolactate synthase regulatory subunit
MAYILNIGLAREGKANLKGISVLRVVRNTGFRVVAAATYVSNTEPTIVVEVMNDSWIAEASAAVVAVRLGQDCIGVYNTLTGNGALIGPRADKWGEFNPEYFLLLDGSRLAQPALKLAA